MTFVADPFGRTEIWHARDSDHPRLDLWNRRERSTNYFDPDSEAFLESSKVPCPKLLRWAAPLVNESILRLRESLLDGTVSAEDRIGLIPLVSGCVPVRSIVRLTYRPLVLELNIARLNERLEGATPSERFTSFADRLMDPEYCRDLWHKYPVAAEECGNLLERWSNNSIRLCQDYHRDRDVVDRLFPLTTNVCVRSVDLNVGDTHSNGRSVSILNLMSCDDSLIHKPRSGAPEVLFALLVTWANEQGFRPQIIATQALNLGDHSWVKASISKPCIDIAEVRDYYTRLGGLIALCYCLSITDIHRDNLVAHGAFPVIVDLETIAHTQLRYLEGHQHVGAAAVRALTMESVLATGILPSPQLHIVSGETVRTDISGMSANEDQVMFVKEPYFANAGMDTMHVDARKTKIESTNHLPMLRGKVQKPESFADEILQGFTQMYRLLGDHREELISDEGPLSSLPRVPIRHITGPTETFSRILWNSYHPDFLRDQAKRDGFLDRIYQTHQEIQVGSALCTSERNQLSNGDIPIFTAFGELTTLSGGDGAEIENAIDRTGFDQVKHRLRKLSPQDLDYQQSVIRGSLRSASIHRNMEWPRAKPRAYRSSASEDWLIDGAVGIADYLLATATWVGGRPYWLNYALEANKYWMPRAVGQDFYSGASGIGVFLAHLGSVTSDIRFTETAKAILDHSLMDLQTASIELASPSLGMTSAFDGLLYLATTWAALTKDANPITIAVENSIKHYEIALSADVNHDVVGGSAGSILALCAASPYVADDSAISKLVLLGLSRLKETARGAPDSYWWPTGLRTETGMIGFSHGSSGIALALGRGASLVSSHDFDDLIAGAFRYERKASTPRTGSSYESRDSNRDALFAWCHGDPGLALSHSSLPARFQTSDTVQDLERAVRSIMSYYDPEISPPPPLNNLSLCHGTLGNLMIIDQLRKGEQDFDGLERCRHQLLDWTRSVFHNDGWVCGVPTGLRSVDLMTGIAGIGYGLLSSREGSNLPSVVSLDSPGLPK